MWVLIGVLIASQGVAVKPFGLYPTMISCFEARDEYMANMPQPKVNYELVCVKTDKITGI